MHFWKTEQRPRDLWIESARKVQGALNDQRQERAVSERSEGLVYIQIQARLRLRLCSSQTQALRCNLHSSGHMAMRVRHMSLASLCICIGPVAF